MDEEQELEWAGELQEARKLHLLNVRAEVEELAERVGRKLQKMIEEGHATEAFMIALFLAGLKDSLDVTLDLLLIGNIPIIGALPGLFLTVIIYVITGPSFKNKMKLKVAWWVLGFFVDGLPFFNALPINTILVLYTWHAVRKDASEAEGKLEKLENITKEELEEIDGAYAEAA